MTLGYTIAFILTLTGAYAQDQAYEESDAVIFRTQRQTTSYHIYDPPFAAKIIYEDTTEAPNFYPEQLMSSIISARNQEWVNYNYLNREGIEKDASHFKEVEQMDPETNFFELRSKFAFEYNGLPAVFIKYYLIFDKMDKPVGAFKVMQKVGERWYLVTIPNFATIPYMLFWFKEQPMLALLKGEASGEPIVNDLINLTRNESGGLDFEKLATEFKKIYQEGERAARYQYFVDPVTFTY